MAQAKAQAEWTRRYYHFTVTDTRTNLVVARETLTTYNMRHSEPCRQRNDAMISSAIVGGIFIPRSEATYYLRNVRSRRNVRGNVRYIVTYTRETMTD